MKSYVEYYNSCGSIKKTATKFRVSHSKMRKMLISQNEISDNVKRIREFRAKKRKK